MKRKMTALAGPSKWGGLAARGFFHSVVPSAATVCAPRKLSVLSMPARATEVKAPPASQRNSRRV